MLGIIPNEIPSKPFLTFHIVYHLKAPYDTAYQYHHPLFEITKLSQVDSPSIFQILANQNRRGEHHQATL